MLRNDDMDQRSKRFGRRGFLQASAVAAMVGARGGLRSAAGAESTLGAATIPTRPFGKTGLQLPILGMGSSAMVGRWSAGYGSNPGSVQQRAALVRHAYDRGVRYFDTARSYDDAEEVIGRGLKGVASQCVIASKVTVLRPDMVRPSVEKSLAVLGVDRVDIMQIHSSGAIEHGGFGPAMKIHAELVKLRDEGLFKYIGLTTHVAFETVYKLIATGGFDQALLTICYFPKGMNTLLSPENRAFREKCLDKARDLKMAVVAMKVLGVSIFGRMSTTVVPDYNPADRAKLPAAAMRWVLNDERVSLLAIGMGHHEEIEQNAATLSSDITLTNDDRRLLTDYSAKAYQSPRIKQLGVDGGARSPEDAAQAAIKQYDANQDGKLSRSEVPQGHTPLFDRSDSDRDGFVTLRELTNALKAEAKK